MSSDLHRECERAVPLFGDAFVRSWLACALAAISCGPAQSRSLPNADQAGAPASVAGSFAGAVSVAGVSGSNGVIAGTSGVAGIAGHSVAGSSAGTAGASGSIAGADAGVATLPTSAADGGMSAGAGGASGSLDSAGVSASAGAGDVAGSAAVSGMSSCAASKPNDRPFGCAFAWGTDDSGGSLSGLSDLQFVSKWVGYEVDASGNLPSCDGCSWLTSEVKSTALVPVYYAYFIGYFGHANGLMDGNQNPNGPNLTTDAANLIRAHRAQIISMYASYAKQTAAAWPDKPLVWLLEGDFVQYAGDSQKNKLSYTELGQLADDISCAIKSGMPNAVVAIDQSSWNADDVTNSFWDAMQAVPYDMVWTTGVANNQGFLQSDTNSTSYNHTTATYAYLHQKTGRKILVDTSFGLSAMSDTWSSADATTLNARIADGVIAANVTGAPSSYGATVKALSSQLQPACN